MVLVALGPAIDMLLEGTMDKNGNPLEIVVLELAARKVEFQFCNNTLVRRAIAKEKV